MGNAVVRGETDFSEYDLSPINDYEHLSWKAAAICFVVINTEGELPLDALIDMTADGEHAVKSGLQELQEDGLVSVESKNIGQKIEYFVSSGVSETKKFDSVKRGDLKNRRDEKFEKLSKRNGQYCKFCGTEKSLEIDHKIPISKGGGNDIENLQLLCETCNRDKGDMEMAEWLRAKRRVQ